jgi:hypothetical protein
LSATNTLAHNFEEIYCVRKKSFIVETAGQKLSFLFVFLSQRVRNVNRIEGCPSRKSILLTNVTTSSLEMTKLNLNFSLELTRLFPAGFQIQFFEYLNFFLIRIGKKTECFISNFIIVFKVALKL